MNSNIAENNLYDIFNLLRRSDITLNDIIIYGNQFRLNNDYVQRDNEAIKLIPDKYADHVCIKSTADGNCFFNSASLIVFGHENNHMQLRLAVMIELMANANYYLQQPVFEQDIFYRDEALNNIIWKIKILMCKPNSWCSMIAFFGLASVLHRPIESLFPNTGNKYMNQLYNWTIMPRQDEYFYPQCIIMWSSTSAADFQNNGQSNHFVPVFKRKEHVQSLKNPIPPLIQESHSLQNDCISLTVDNKIELTNNNKYITDNEANQNTLIGLFMGIDSAYVPNIDK
ncbi:hypothetical protein RhiirA4_482135, partial [Rhizophagus irregularis]